MKRLLPLSLFLVPLALRAEVKLPALVSDNMVLQQDLPADVWGTAAPGEKVSVTLSGKSAQAVADSEGKWSVKLEGLLPGTSGDMTVAGQNTLTVKNVAVGEVWVASGQSNMEFAENRAMNAEQEAAAADFPQIRMFTVKRNAALEPQPNCEGKWEVCNPQSVKGFSAVGYFFARNLWQNLQVPIGVIHTSWGGTPAEYWTPPDVLSADPDFAGAFTTWERLKANYPAAKAKYDEDLAKYKVAAEQAKAEGKPAGRPPTAPRGGDNLGAPGCLFNGMIVPVLPYTIRGAIWYQGEANAGNAKGYQKLFPTMIQSWRARWGEGEFPFLYVQLANYMARHDQPTQSNWAALREAQTETLELNHTGMAVAIDIGEEKDIHPKNKQEVGRRLAICALATVYYRDMEYSGPLLAGAQEEDGRMRLTFRFAEGLKTSDGGKPTGFAIAGEDKKFVWADAEIQGDHVIVSSPEVKAPVAVRYAWADNPECNIVNGAGLPASPFRTDNWPTAPAPAAAAPAPAPAVAAPAK